VRHHFAQGAPLSTFCENQTRFWKENRFQQRHRSNRIEPRSITGRNIFKKWLAANAPKANVTGKFDISLNAVSVSLNGTSLATIKTCPTVKDAQYETLYYPTVDDPDLSLIKAVEAWQVGGGPANAGAEVKVAIIDTGLILTIPVSVTKAIPPKPALAILDLRTTGHRSESVQQQSRQPRLYGRSHPGAWNPRCRHGGWQLQHARRGWRRNHSSRDFRCRAEGASGPITTSFRLT